ncbi:MAG: DUF2130 domain-containing protein [Candidatus Roizmanbacteria bacterium]|nr:MAG: DUF2130 domain-containing protein [Candidatus Roizmanbacteria bacterium]
MNDQIICPNCKNPIPLSEALSHKLKEQFEEDHKKEMESAIAQAVQKKLEENDTEMKDLKTQLEEQTKKMSEFRDQELKLREEKRKIAEEKKDLELSVQRRIDSERKRIEEAVLEKVAEDQRFKDAEKDKLIEGLKKSLEEAQRKAQVGSQQMQGEVLELDLQNLLMKLFPQDEIEEIGKGVNGADIRQTVKSPKGMSCGTILWECKRKKAWSDGDVVKLKEDLRRDNDNFGVIVATSLPKQNKSGLCLIDGVWVCSFLLSDGVALMLRRLILDVAYQKAVSVHRGEKSDLLYSYVTSNKFQQQFEIMVEVYTSMKEQLRKERDGFKKIWSERESQLERYINSAANIYGSMQGLVGSSMPQIKGFDVFELESGKAVDEE